MALYTPGFGTSRNKGFHIRFPNGLTLSTQFGGGNYGSNYDAEIGSMKDHQAVTVEIAVFEGPSGRWRTREIAKAAGLPDPSDDVIGYVVFEDWLKIFDATRSARVEGKEGG